MSTSALSPESLLRTVVANAPIILFAMDARGTITFSDGAGLARQGLRPGEVVGRSIFELYEAFPDFLEDVRRALDGAPVISTGATLGGTFERRMLPLFDASGHPDGVVGVTTDVTERVAAEQRLQQSEQQFRDLVEGSLQGIVVFRSHDHRPLFMNEAYARIHGYDSTAELEGRDLLEILVPPELRAERKAMTERRLTGSDTDLPDVYETENLRKDGSRVPLLRYGRRVQWHGEPAIQITSVDLTGLRQVEQRLRQSEQQFRDLVEGSLQGIVVHRNEHAVFMNAAYARIHGYDSVDELMGCNLVETLVPPELRAERRDMAARRHTDPTLPEIYESEHLRRDGSRVPLLFFVRGIQWQGEPAIQVATVDLTGLRKAEQRLQESESLYRGLVESSQQGIVVLDETPVIVYCNQVWLDMMGYPDLASFRAAREAGHVFSEEMLHEIYGRLDSLKRGEVDEQRADITWRHSDGTQRWGDYQARRVTWQGKPALLATVLDVTERRRTLNALAEKEWALSRAQQAANVGTWYRDLRDGSMRWSDQTYEIFGKDPQRFTPHFPEYLELMHPEDRDRVLRKDEEARADPGQFTNEYRIVRSDGAVRIVQIQGEPLADESGIVYALIGTLQDVTERRDTERRLAHAEKMEAVGRLTGGVAHDFNNLLTVVQGNLELLSMEPGLPAPALELVGNVKSAAERGADLTRLMLSFARGQSLAPEPVHAREVLEGLERLLQRTLGSAIRVEVAAPSDVWPVLADRAQLESAVINLAVNARDAMPGGGTLHVEAQNVPAGEPDADGLEPGNGGYVRLRVSDTGEGIAPEHLEKVFDPFFTTKAPGHGTGMGLSMVYGFVTQSGGTVELDSEPGRGTTVSLLLPRASGEPRAERPRTRAAGWSRTPTPAHQGRVIVVEGDLAVRQLAERALARFGFDTLAVSNADAGLALLREVPDVHMLLLDIAAPGARACLQHGLRAECPALPVLLTAPEPADLDAARSSMGGPLAAVRKPFTLDHLADALQRLELLQR